VEPDLGNTSEGIVAGARAVQARAQIVSTPASLLVGGLVFRASCPMRQPVP